VRDRVGLSRAQIYRMINTGDFPAPVRPSPGTVAWNEVEVDAWIEARIATSKKAGDA